jgi:TatD DNase family protein
MGHGSACHGSGRLVFVLVDSHAHVQVHQFASDRAEVVAAAFAAGIGRIIVPGTDLDSSRAAVDLAAAYPGRIFAAVGTHPHDAATLTDQALGAQRRLASAAGVVAVGEIGLDYYRNLAPQEVQRAALVAQFQLARELDLPVILHTRESHTDMVAHLRTHGASLRGVFHCFTGDRDMAREALDLGFYLSFAGPVTYPRNTELLDVAAWVPQDRLLVETDSPYLAPQPFRGKRNEPRHVALVAQAIAAARGMTPEALAAATSQNAATLFRLPPEDTQKGNAAHASL